MSAMMDLFTRRLPLDELAERLVRLLQKLENLRKF